MCLEQEHKPRSKNRNPKIKIQKLKILKSPFSQTHQYHQILKPHSIKSIKKYNTTNPNKKISKSEQPISFKKKPRKPISFKKKPTSSKPRFGGHAPRRRALLRRKARSTTTLVGEM